MSVDSVGNNLYQYGNDSNYYTIPATNFRASQNPISQDSHDSIEINEKTKTCKHRQSLSTNEKIGIGLGVLATIIGGLLLHKRCSNKVPSKGQQLTREFSQAIKNLINDGRITTKEATMFEELKELEGDEFITKAYDLIAREIWD